MTYCLSFMKRRTFLLLLIAVVISSCATLDINEIRSLDRIPFDPPGLKPSMELNNLRLDIVRKTEDREINDSTTRTEEVPYNRFGFNLGNGLFYDLNENLSIRIDDLMSLSNEACFVVSRSARPSVNGDITLLSFINDSLTVKYPPRKKAFYMYHLTHGEGKTTYWRKNRQIFTVTETDTSLICTGRKREWYSIVKTGGNTFLVKRGRWTEQYLTDENSVTLENDYVVTLSPDRLELYIMRKGRKHDRLWYTIVKSDDVMFIFNRKYSGKKIEFTGDGMLIYSDKRLSMRYRKQSCD